MVLPDKNSHLEVGWINFILDIWLGGKFHVASFTGASTSSMGAVQTEDVGTSLAQNNTVCCHCFGECLGSTKHAKRKSSCFQDLSSLRFDEEESVSLQLRPQNEEEAVSNFM